MNQGTALPMRAVRTTIRFPLEATVAFSWHDETGETQQGEGRTRDISEHGVFVYTQACPPVGITVRLRILLEDITDLAQPLRIQVEGHVLRVEEPTPERKNSGFAVMSDEVMLRDAEQLSD